MDSSSRPVLRCPANRGLPVPVNMSDLAAWLSPATPTRNNTMLLPPAPVIPDPSPGQNHVHGFGSPAPDFGAMQQPQSMICLPPVFGACADHHRHLLRSYPGYHAATGLSRRPLRQTRSPNRGTGTVCSKSPRMEKVINTGYIRPVINTLHTPSYSKLLQVTPSYSKLVKTSDIRPGIHTQDLMTMEVYPPEQEAGVGKSHAQEPGQGKMQKALQWKRKQARALLR